MRNIKIIYILATIFLPISCNNEEEVAKNKGEYLIGVWKITETKTYKYLNGKLNKVNKEEQNDETYPLLTFKSNGDVIYKNPKFAKEIIGKWSLDGNTLKTDLKAETEFPITYFFLVNEVNKISENKLMLKTPINENEIFSINSIGNIEKDKTKSYKETYLEK